MYQEKIYILIYNLSGNSKNAINGIEDEKSDLSFNPIFLFLFFF